MVAPLVGIAVAAARIASSIVIRGVARAALNTENTKALQVSQLKSRIADSLVKSGMAPGIQTKVLGIRDVQAMLREMSEKTRNRIVRSAIRQGALIMMAQVQRRTYDHKLRIERTGLMGRAVRVTTRVQADTVKAFVTPNRRGQPSPYYWWFLERGTKNRKTRKTSADRGRVTPRPWVAPAFNATQAEAINKISSSLRSGVEREMRRQRAGG